MSSPSNVLLPSYGALLKSAWLILKARFWVLVALEAIPIVLGFIYGFAAAIIFKVVQPTGAGRIILVFLTVILVLVIAVITLWSYAALFHAIKDHQERLGIKAAYQRGWKQLPAFVWLNILTGLVVFGAMIPLIIPGLILGVWFSFALWVLIDEKSKGSQALWASREYVRGAWWAVWGRILFFTLLGLIIIGIIYVPIFVLAGKSAAAQNIVPFVKLIFYIIWGPFALAYFYSIYQALKTQKGEVQAAVTSGRKVSVSLLAIWGVLAMVLVVVSVGLFAGKGLFQARKENRNARRELDLRQIQGALDIYFADQGKYPEDLLGLQTAGFMTILPTDPQTGQPYDYNTSMELDEYKLCAKTEPEGDICHNSPSTAELTPDPITDPRVYLPLFHRDE